MVVISIVIVFSKQIDLKWLRRTQFTLQKNQPCVSHPYIYHLVGLFMLINLCYYTTNLTSIELFTTKGSIEQN